MTWLPALQTWALVLFAGAGCARGLGLRGRGPESLGLALLIGASLLAGLVTLLSPGYAVGRGPLVAGLVLIGLVGYVVGSGRSKKDRPAEPGSLGAWLGFAPALLVVGLTLAQAASRPVYNVDAQRRWVLHGQWTAEYGSATPTEVQDTSWGTSHPSYPPVITGLTALCLELGADRDWGLRPLFPVFLLALLASVFGYARRRAGPLAAGAICLALALVPALSIADELGLGAAAAHADVALAAYLTSLSVLLLERLSPTRETAEAPLFALGLVTLGAVWTKNEGMAFALAMLLATAGLLALVRRGKPARECLVLFFVALVGTALWKWVARDMPVAEGEDYVSGGILAALMSGLGRLPEIAGRLGAELVDLRLWGPLWLLVPIWLLVRPWRAARDRVATLLPALWLLLGLGLVTAAYLATGWKDGRFLALMDVSVARLLLHHAPLVALLVVGLLERPEPTRGFDPGASSGELSS